MTALRLGDVQAWDVFCWKDEDADLTTPPARVVRVMARDATTAEVKADHATGHIFGWLQATPVGPVTP